MRATLPILILVSMICYHHIDASLFDDEILHALRSNVPSPRGIVSMTVLENAPVRLRVEMELTNPATNAKNRFFVEGLVCQNGFNQYVGDAICRSQNKRCVAVIPNLPFRPDPINLKYKCYFQYAQDQLEIQYTYLLDKFICPCNALNLNACNHTDLFEHQCAGDMHVGVMCV